MPDSQNSGAGILIPAFVIQMNNQQFITDGVIGHVENVPCRNVFVDEVLYWASPVKDEGIFSAIEFRLVNGDNIAKPTYDSFLVQRIRDKLSNYTWWVYVNTANDFKNSCNTCCGAASIPMPGITGDFNPVIAPCQTLCAENADGDLEGVFGLPTLSGSQQYYPYGSYDNVALSSSGSSFASIAALLVYLNANWTNVGSPNTTFVWTASGTTLIATGGIAGHQLCVTVLAIAPSP